MTPRSRQYGRRLTEADIHSFSIFAPVMGVVFGIVGLLLIALSLRRLVSSQRRELGALLAIGYPPRAVVGSVMLLAAALAVLGAVLAIGATIGVGRLVADEYASAVGFPATQHPLAFGPLALAVGLAVAATLLAALLPAYRLARLDPIEALRGESVGAFELPGWLQRLTALGPPALTYGLRGLLRRPLLSAATVISIAGAVGLGAALNILVSSTNNSVDAAFAGQGWTHSADLARPLPDGRAAALARRAGAARAEPTVKGPAELSAAGGGEVGAQLTGLPRRPALLGLDITSGTAPGRAGSCSANRPRTSSESAPGTRSRCAPPNGRRPCMSPASPAPWQPNRPTCCEPRRRACSGSADGRRASSWPAPRRTPAACAPTRPWRG